MNNPLAINTPAQYAVKFVTEYDSCMRRGGVMIGKEPVMMGNIPLMTTLMNLSHMTALTATTPSGHAFIKDIGNAVKGYWTGATIVPFPTYPIPAPGSIQNLFMQSGMVTNPGTWPSVPFEIPTTSCLTFLSAFTMFAKIHLFTVQGMFMTTSLYPSAPSPIPAPGVVNWQAYNIPDVPMFGITKSQNSSTDAPNTNDNIAKGPLEKGNTDFDIRDKTRIGFKTETEKDADRLGLDTSFPADAIDEELREKLAGSDDILEKADMILQAEAEKDQLGMDRFYSEAIQAVGNLASIQPDANEIFAKNLFQLQKELEKERKLCCNDCT
tara:strand:+ start:964 stop:1938 length:975 start_codon:yes stop_codon:yes gene_type:complete